MTLKHVHLLIKPRIQASIAVLLVLFFGYYSQKIGWVNEEGEKVLIFRVYMLLTLSAPS